jgi:hypothetical protein
MRKRLFIRFFRDKEDQIPMDSNPISDAHLTATETSRLIAEQSDVVFTHLYHYMNGKVDFVWL